MSTLALMAAAGLYVAAAWGHFARHDTAMGIVFVAYAIANLGLAAK